jgi:hypothetical protein
MKFALKRPQLNRRWLMLGGAIVLGIVATGLNQRAPHDRMAQLNVQVRAVNRMVSAVAARRDLARSAQVQPAVSAAICLWSLQPAVLSPTCPWSLCGRTNFTHDRSIEPGIA